MNEIKHFDDLDELVSRLDKKNPDFKNQVSQRVKELEIAYLLRKAREDKKLTQKDIAEKLHVSQQAISFIEKAKEYHGIINTIRKYADLLGYELELNLKKK